MRRIEWLTVALIAACTAAWMVSVWMIGQGYWLFVVPAIFMVTLHSSLQHEVLHGHPTRNRYLNEALVFFGIGLFFPYRRFKTTHLIHHRDPYLTDPYEDPETNYLAPEDWDRLSAPWQVLRNFNNTLLGRLTIGPAIGVLGFWLNDLRAALKGDMRVVSAWVLHLIGLVPVYWWVVLVSGLSPLLYVFGVAYWGYSLLTVRTFLEHRAEQAYRKRTCIIEDPSGFFGLLFLHNNLHVVHHTHPTMPWYDIPAAYRAGKAQYVESNGGYTFPSYRAIFREYFLKSKGPVPHPFWKRPESGSRSNG